MIKDRLCIVLELAKDGSLNNYIEKNDRKNFSDEEASQIMKSVLTAVEYIHKKGIVHRDIKPG
jgi:serine/threonine protein kinase